MDIIDDIKSIKKLPNDISVVCAGFPCQNLRLGSVKRRDRWIKIRINKSSSLESYEITGLNGQS